MQYTDDSHERNRPNTTAATSDRGLNEREDFRLFESPEQDMGTTRVAAHIDNPNALISRVAAQESTNRRAYWKQRSHAADHMPDHRPDGDYARRMTLATQERMEGEGEELNRHQEKAMAVAEADPSVEERVPRDYVLQQCDEAPTFEDLDDDEMVDLVDESVPGVDPDASHSMDRAVKCREAVSDMFAQRREEWEERTIPERRRREVAPDGDDPRAHLDSSKVAIANQQGQKVACKFDQVSEAVASRLIAYELGRGQSGIQATFSVMEEFRHDRTMIRPIADIEPSEFWDGEGIAVQGRVTKLFDPAHRSQYQVGILEDGSGQKARFTLWRLSGKDVRFNEGAFVKLTDTKVGEYQGRVTLAITSDTDIRILEHGDGPAPTCIQSRDELPSSRGTGTAAEVGAGDAGAGVEQDLGVLRRSGRGDHVQKHTVEYSHSWTWEWPAGFMDGEPSPTRKETPWLDRVDWGEGECPVPGCNHVSEDLPGLFEHIEDARARLDHYGPHDMVKQDLHLKGFTASTAEHAVEAAAKASD